LFRRREQAELRGGSGVPRSGHYGTRHRKAGLLRQGGLVAGTEAPCARHPRAWGPPLRGGWTTARSCRAPAHARWPTRAGRWRARWSR